MLFSFYVWELAQIIVLLKIHKNKSDLNDQGVNFPKIRIIDLLRGLFFLVLSGVIAHLIAWGLNHTVGYILLLYPVLVFIIASKISLEEIEGLKRIPWLSFYAFVYNTAIKNKMKERLLFLWPKVVYYISSFVVISVGLMLIIYNKFIK